MLNEGKSVVRFKFNAYGLVTKLENRRKSQRRNVWIKEIQTRIKEVLTGTTVVWMEYEQKENVGSETVEGQEK